MYALKIRKSDLGILTLLNNGVTPTVEKKTTYLIVNPDGASVIVDEKQFDNQFASRISTAGPLLMKLNKS